MEQAIKAPKFKMYTPEQRERLAMLRASAEIERRQNIAPSGPVEKFGWNIEVGDDCTICFDGITIVGNVIAKRILSTYSTKYDVNTPLGVIKNFSNNYSEKRSIRKRIRTDLSGIEIPEQLKTVYTQKLLRMLYIARIEGSYKGFGENDVIEKYSIDELKAELATRPHIPNKKEKKVISAWQRSHND